MRYVFGPVPSRRLGRSLGVDPVPLKTCNWNCVYCQLGRSRPVINERRRYVPPESVVSELAQVLAERGQEAIDWVTFAGSGEPLLHCDIGWMVREAKKITNIPVAMITNGTLLYMEDVRRELLTLDAILPSLNAGSEEMYRRVNRPHPDASFSRHVEGLEAFAREFDGKVWVGVMLVAGLNDGEDALRDIAEVVSRIVPDEVHINLPVRAPAESWVQSPDDAALLRAMAILGDVAHVVHPAAGEFDLGTFTDVSDAVTAIVSRHPMREDELRTTLAPWEGELDDALRRLLEGGKLQVVERHGVRFWCSSETFYPAGEPPPAGRE